MNKIIMLLCALSLLLCLCGCGEKYKCQLCGDEKSGKGNEYTVGGETYILCDECYEPFEEAGK